MFVSGNNRTFCALLFAFLPHGTPRLRVSTRLAAGVLKREVQELSKYRGKSRSSVFVPFSRIARIKIDMCSSLRHIRLRPIWGTYGYLHGFSHSAHFEWSTSNTCRITLGTIWILGCTCSRDGLGISGDEISFAPVPSRIPGDPTDHLVIISTEIFGSVFLLDIIDFNSK